MCCRYELVLFLDSDVDLFLHTAGRPPPAHTEAHQTFARAWIHARSAFLASGAEILASPDPHVPISGGVFLLRPSAEVYALGVNALRSLQFDFSDGFNASGTPRAVLPTPTYPQRS